MSENNNQKCLNYKVFFKVSVNSIFIPCSSGFSVLLKRGAVDITPRQDSHISNPSKSKDCAYFSAVKVVHASLKALFKPQIRCDHSCRVNRKWLEISGVCLSKHNLTKDHISSVSLQFCTQIMMKLLPPWNGWVFCSEVFQVCHITSCYTGAF